MSLYFTRSNVGYIVLNFIWATKIAPGASKAVALVPTFFSIQICNLWHKATPRNDSIATSVSPLDHGSFFPHWLVGQSILQSAFSFKTLKGVNTN